jgi:UPF0271 protein
VGGITQLFRIYTVPVVIDLNADVGEWDAGPPPAEVELMSVISSASVACGVHAGHAAAMAATVELAARHSVAVGAHPSLDDRAHFGRREIAVSTADAFTLVSTQVGALARIAAARGVRLRHVKPHGALYNMAARDRRIADAIATAVAAFDRELVLFGLAGSELIAAGTSAGLGTASEVFADRGYLADGSLAPRSMPGAIIEDVDVAAARAVAMVCDSSVIALDGTRVPVSAQTICVHGDAAGAAVMARRIRTALEAAGVLVSARR